LSWFLLLVDAAIMSFPSAATHTPTS